MENSRKVILYIATSLDGYIAREDGGIDWLQGDGSDPQGDLGYLKFYETIDTVIMGKTTYDQVLTFGEYPYKGIKNYVFTSESRDNRDDVIFINENVKELIDKLKRETGKSIWVIGGAGILDYFMKENLIDEYIISIIPTILGKGISLFKGNNPEINLQLKHSKNINGIVEVHYVKK